MNIRALILLFWGATVVFGAKRFPNHSLLNLALQKSSEGRKNTSVVHVPFDPNNGTLQTSAIHYSECPEASQYTAFVVIPPTSTPPELIEHNLSHFSSLDTLLTSYSPLHSIVDKPPESREDSLQSNQDTKAIISALKTQAFTVEIDCGESKFILDLPRVLNNPNNTVLFAVLNRAMQNAQNLKITVIEAVASDNAASLLQIDNAEHVVAQWGQLVEVVDAGIGLPCLQQLELGYQKSSGVLAEMELPPQLLRETPVSLTDVLHNGTNFNQTITTRIQEEYLDRVVEAMSTSEVSPQLVLQSNHSTLTLDLPELLSCPDISPQLETLKSHLRGAETNTISLASLPTSAAHAEIPAVVNIDLMKQNLRLVMGAIHTGLSEFQWPKARVASLPNWTDWMNGLKEGLTFSRAKPLVIEEPKGHLRGSHSKIKTLKPGNLRGKPVPPNPYAPSTLTNLVTALFVLGGLLVQSNQVYVDMKKRDIKRIKSRQAQENIAILDALVDDNPRALEDLLLPIVPALSAPTDAHDALKALAALQVQYRELVMKFADIKMTHPKHLEALSLMVVALRAAPGEFWDKPTPENFTVFKERCESIITRAEARFGVHHGFDAVRDWFRQLTNFMTQLFVRIGKCMRLLNHAYEPKLYAKPSTQAQLLWNENKNFKEELLGNSEAHTPGLLDNVADEVTQHNAEKPKP